jgi:DNA polymerase-3 subunit epsilon
MATRSVVLDTETTGMPVTDGHRIIEIGCVELIGRRLTGRHFHVYLQPDRESDEGAIGVHGITNEFLVGKPRFAEVADEFFEFIKGAQLIIHNAAFDVGFINNEFALMGQHDRADISQHCTILDTLMMAGSVTRGSATASMPCANATASTTPAVNCTAPCSTPRFSPTFT